MESPTFQLNFIQDPGSISNRFGAVESREVALKGNV